MEVTGAESGKLQRITAAESGKLQRITAKIRSFFSVITIEPMLLIQGIWLLIILHSFLRKKESKSKSSGSDSAKKFICILVFICCGLVHRFSSGLGFSNRPFVNFTPTFFSKIKSCSQMAFKRIYVLKSYHKCISMWTQLYTKNATLIQYMVIFIAYTVGGVDFDKFFISKL
jgi:hypothetical protein